MKRILKTCLTLWICLGCSFALVGCNYGGDVKSSNVEYDGAETFAENGVASDAAHDAGVDVENPNVQKEAKRIYHGNMMLQTIAFEDVQSMVNQTVKKYDGYIENESVNDSTSWNDDEILRYGNMMIRVPVENFEKLIQEIEACDDLVVKSKSVNTDDVSESYYDIENRLSTYQVKLKRLQELLSEAQNVSEVMEIENGIADVQYQIESLKGQLQHYDSKISYSTLDVSIQEVNVLMQSNRTAGYGNKIVASFVKGFTSGIAFLADLLLFVLRSWLLFVMIGGVVYVIRKKTKPKREAKKREQIASQQEVMAVRKIISEIAEESKDK